MEQSRRTRAHVPFVTVLVIVVVASLAGVAQAAGAGSPDPSWGTDGASQPVPYRYVSPRRIEVAPDGTAYFMYSGGGGPTDSSWIHRYTPAGVLDTTFAPVTLVATPSPRLEVQPAPEGYALVAVEQGHLIRVTADGERDPRFASSATTATTRATTDLEISATGDRIVTLGSRGAALGYWVNGPMPCGWPCPYIGAGSFGAAAMQVVAAYDRDGAADRRFAGGEVAFGQPSAYAVAGGPCAVVTCVFVGAYANEAGQLRGCVVLVCSPATPGIVPFAATDVALDPDGGVFVGGFFRDPRLVGQHIPAVVHLLADGTIDRAFGDHGVLLGHDGWARGDVVEVMVDRDARLLVLHRTCEPGCVQQVVRLAGDELDPAFAGGVVRLPGWAGMSANLVEAPDGGLFVFRPGRGVTRLTSGGEADTTFGTDGEVTDPTGSGRGAVDAAGRPYLSDRDNDGYTWVVRLLAAATNTGIEDPADPVLTGSVSDRRTGGPIPGATVDCVVAVAVTDAAGIYRIELPVGNYQCTASAPGYASKKQRVTVSGSGGSADFALRQL